MAAVRLGAVVAAVALASVAFISEVSGANSDAEIEQAIQQELPRPRTYSWVALPTTPPPGDAYLVTTASADHYEYGQQVMLQYNAFTVYACAVRVGSAAEGSCARRDGTRLRTVRDGRTLTVWSVSTKFLDDPKGAAPDLFDQISRYLDQAEFTTTPPWVRPYAEEQLRTRMYGQS